MVVSCRKCGPMYGERQKDVCRMLGLSFEFIDFPDDRAVTAEALALARILCTEPYLCAKSPICTAEP